MSSSNDGMRRLAGVKANNLVFEDDLAQDLPAEPDAFAACGNDSNDSLQGHKHGRRSSVHNRRRSSIGLINSSRRASLSESEQSRIVEMYKTVIQMSSENKLTEKNSWNFDLIDHMGRLIKDESKGVNFQKASCTLDASVKIYSNRVDDTYATSHRILESLSRNGRGPEDDGDAPGPDGERPKVKVGTKASSTRLNAVDTIERNPENLNAVKLDHEYAFDPMFHKLSKAFDEGGARGMLLYNMRVTGKDCSLAFHRSHDASHSNTTSSTTEGHAHHTSNTAGTAIDMHDLLQRSGLTVDKLRGMKICPKLHEYRHIAGITERHVGTVPTSGHATTLSSFTNNDFSPSTTNESVGGSPSQMHTHGASHQVANELFPAYAGESQATTGAYANNDDFENTNYDNNNYEMGNNDIDYCNDDVVYDVDETPVMRSSRPSAANANNAAGRSSMMSTHSTAPQHGWDIVEEMDEQRKLDSQREVMQSLEALKMQSGSDYSYFNLDALSAAGNAWAGAKHWKYATRSVNNKAAAAAAVAAANSGTEESKQDADGQDESVVEEGKGKKGKAAAKPKKETVVLTFSAQLVDGSKFITTKSKSDTTLMTKAAMQKMEEDSDSLLLPIDEKVRVKDLCRLFQWPNVIVTPRHMNALSITGGTQANTPIKSRAQMMLDAMAGEEMLWGKSASSTSNVKSGSIAAFDDNNNGLPVYGGNDDLYYDNDGGYDMNDVGGGGDDNRFSVEPTTSDLLPPATPFVAEGLNINQQSLLQAERQVEKINIRYEKVSKRVNVHKLKGDMLQEISEKLDGTFEDNAANESKASSSAHTKILSFQGMVQNMSTTMQQKDVTLPYYFICLLHLANEEGLVLQGSEDLSDLTIAFDRSEGENSANI